MVIGMVYDMIYELLNWICHMNQLLIKNQKNHQFWCGPQMITFSRSGPLLPALGTKDCTCDRHGRLNVSTRHFFLKPFPAGEASRTTRYTRKMDIPNHDMLIYQQYKQS